jgi:hypothetical protein
VRTRRILIAILAAALVGVDALSVASKGHKIEFRLPFGLVASVLIFGLAAWGNRLAWGIAFVLSVFGAAGGVILALSHSTDQAYGWLGAALFGIAGLALAGLDPDREHARSEPQKVQKEA